MDIISVAMITASEFFAEPLVGIFSAGNEKIQQIALSGFRIFAINYLLCGMNIFASGLFTALNNGKISAVISVARTLVFECAAMLILPMFIGINGVWSALPVAELCAVAISVTFIIANAKKYHLVGVPPHPVRADSL